jgi:elongation factor 1-beta
MGTALLKIKVMPEQGVDVEELKKKIEEAIAKINGKVNSFEEEEVAFGLKALIATIVWPEEQETSQAEDTLKGIEGVSSLDVVDYRRAFG